MNTAPPSLPLAPTVTPLLAAAQASSIRAALELVSSMGFRHVQLSATQPGLRPRELDHSARRDLLATLRRRELAPAGLDCWIPVEHLQDASRIDRAVEAIIGAIKMAADLGRCPVSVQLPGGDAPLGASTRVVQTLAEVADHHGVQIADHQVPPASRTDGPLRVGIDAVALLTHSLDPAAEIIRCAGVIAAVRVADLTRAGLRSPLGSPDGRLRLLDFKVALGVASHAVPTVLDARQWPEPIAGLRRSLEVWNDADNGPSSSR